MDNKMPTGETRKTAGMEKIAGELEAIRQKSGNGGEPMKIRFCEHNKGSGKAYKRIEKEFPKLSVKRKDCIKKCGQCHKNPFAVVDGKTICAVDSDELYRKIVSKLK